MFHRQWIMHTSGCSRRCCLVYALCSIVCAMIASLSPIACRLIFLFSFVPVCSFIFGEQLPHCVIVWTNVARTLLEMARTETYLSLVRCTFSTFRIMFIRRINRSLHITMHTYIDGRMENVRRTCWARVRMHERMTVDIFSRSIFQLRILCTAANLNSNEWDDGWVMSRRIYQYRNVLQK